MLRRWSQFVPNLLTDIRGHEALHHHHHNGCDVAERHIITGQSVTGVVLRLLWPSWRSYAQCGENGI